MKNLVLICLFACGISFVYGQNGTLEGNVKNEAGETLIGVNVFVPKLTMGDVTDLDGNYSFELPVGNHRVSVTQIGYGDRVFDVTITEGAVTKLDVVLEESSQDIETVVVTGTFATRTQKETPLSMTYISSKKLTQLQSNSQADILRTVPGITAEGGGGEVASNIFVRGLPSGGQYQFTPIQIDGMPVLSTFGLNSSAHDVYFRNDLGFRSLEFVRGGISTLFGVGSVAGIINYDSKTGGEQPESIVQMEWANQGRYKADFFSSGSFGEGSNTYYAFTGTYRYDEGPIYTGFPSEGVQFRGNIKKVLDKGTLTISGQYIDDVAQFYLPLPLDGGSRDRLDGNDGEELMTLQTSNAGELSYRTPNGIYQSPVRDGVRTTGGYAMATYNQYLGNGFKFNGKIRYSRYEHEFNFFLDGSGVGGANVVESQSEYADVRLPDGAVNPEFTYADNGRELPDDHLLFENRILDRNRPMSEISGEFNLTKTVTTGSFDHNITLGTFLSKTNADDFNVITRYLGELNNQPRLVNMAYTDSLGNRLNYAVNGVTGRGVGYTNRIYGSAKQAAYLTNQITSGKWNFDVGVRVERAVGDISIEGSQSYLMDESDNIGENLENVTWGNGSWQHGRVSATDAAAAIGALYKLNEAAGVYANFSRGYFFPELRGTRFRADGQPESYNPENIIQGEVGLKYGKGKLSGTVAAYYTTLSDRRQTEFVNQPDGSVDEVVSLTSTQTIGVEVNLNYFITKNLAVMGNFTFQDHELTQFEPDPSLVGNWLFRQPQTIGMAGLSFDNGKIDALASTNYIGKKYANNTNTIELDPINIVRLDAGYTIPIKEGGKSVRLGFSVFNLLDDAGVTEGSPRLGDNQTEAEYFVGRPILPRRIFVRLKYEF